MGRYQPARLTGGGILLRVVGLLGGLVLLGAVIGVLMVLNVTEPVPEWFRPTGSKPNPTGPDRNRSPMVVYTAPSTRPPDTGPGGPMPPSDTQNGDYVEMSSVVVADNTTTRLFTWRYVIKNIDRKGNVEIEVINTAYLNNRPNESRSTYTTSMSEIPKLREERTSLYTSAASAASAMAASSGVKPEKILPRNELFQIGTHGLSCAVSGEKATIKDQLGNMEMLSEVWTTQDPLVGLTLGGVVKFHRRTKSLSPVPGGPTIVTNIDELTVITAYRRNGKTGEKKIDDEKKSSDPGVRVKAPENLIRNGGFEVGAAVGRYRPVDKGSKEVNEWVVTRGQIDWLGTHIPAADGKRCVDLNGSPGIGGVAQSFATTAGKTYRLEFDQSAYPELETSNVGVEVAGTSQTFKVNVKGSTWQAPKWATQAMKFTAKDKTTTLEFYSLDRKDPVSGPIIDNVRVVLID